MNRDRIARWHVAAIVTLVALSLAGQSVRIFFHHDRLFGLIRDFDLNQEGNVPTWFQTCVLAFAAALMFAASRASEVRRPRDAWWWRVLAVGTTLLSIDEASSFHERMRLPLHWLRGIPAWWSFSWVVAGLAAVLTAALLLRNWMNTLPGPTRRELGLAGTIFVLGAVGFEALGGIQAITTGLDTTLYVLTYTTEETLEMVAGLIAIQGLLGYLSNLEPPAPLYWGEAP